MILTSTKLIGRKVESTVKIGGIIYPTNTASGMALERAISNSHAVPGLHSPQNMITVQDDIAGAKTSYPILKDKFLSLLNGYGVRASMVQIFA